MASITDISDQMFAISQIGLTVISLATDANTDFYEVPIRIAWRGLRGSENVAFVQHGRDETLALARSIGLDLAPHIDSSPTAKPTLFLRTYFPSTWDTPDEEFQSVSGSSCQPTVKAFVERCIREWQCALIVLDDSRKYPGQSPEVLVGLHELGKSRAVRIVHFRSDKVRSSYSLKSLAADPRVALFGRTARALPVDVCVLAVVPDKRHGFALFCDINARKLTSRPPLPRVVLPALTEVLARSPLISPPPPPPFNPTYRQEDQVPSAIWRIWRKALIGIGILAAILSLLWMKADS